MKTLYTILAIAFLLVSCSPSEDNNSNTSNTSNGAPKLIAETGGWHVHSGQRVPLSVGETAIQLQYENGHLTQSYSGMFYANPNTTTYDFARCTMQGDSIFCRQTSFEYTPFSIKKEIQPMFVMAFYGNNHHIQRSIYQELDQHLMIPIQHCTLSPVQDTVSSLLILICLCITMVVLPV